MHPGNFGNFQSFSWPSLTMISFWFFKGQNPIYPNPTATLATGGRTNTFIRAYYTLNELRSSKIPAAETRQHLRLVPRTTNGAWWYLSFRWRRSYCRFRQGDKMGCLHPLLWCLVTSVGEALAMNLIFSFFACFLAFSLNVCIIAFQCLEKSLPSLAKTSFWQVRTNDHILHFWFKAGYSC